MILEVLFMWWSIIYTKQEICSKEKKKKKKNGNKSCIALGLSCGTPGCHVTHFVRVAKTLWNLNIPFWKRNIIYMQKTYCLYVRDWLKIYISSFYMLLCFDRWKGVHMHAKWVNESSSKRGDEASGIVYIPIPPCPLMCVFTGSYMEQCAMHIKICLWCKYHLASFTP